MRKAQKGVVAFGLLLILGLCLFPPHLGYLDLGTSDMYETIGHHPLWSEPSSDVVAEAMVGEASSSRKYRFSALIDLRRFGIMFILIVSMTVGMYVILKPRPQQPHA